MKKTTNRIYYHAKKGFPHLPIALLVVLASQIIHQAYADQKDMYSQFSGIANSSPVKSIQFTPEEKDYLSRKQQIQLCVDPDWMPFEKIDDSGKYEGIVADLFTLMAKRANVNFSLVSTENWLESLNAIKEKRCDILSMAIPTPERHQYLRFTEPYISFPMVIATLDNTLFIHEIEEVIDKPLVVVRGFAFAELLRNHYPEIQLTEVENERAGLEYVRSGDAFGFIDTLAPIVYTIQQNRFTDLNITGKFDIFGEYSIGIRNDEPVLQSIMQKMADSLSEQDKIQSYNNWILLTSKPVVLYSVVWKIVAGALLIVCFVLYWNRKLYFADQKTKEALSNLQLAHNELDTIFNQSMVGIIYVDGERIIRRANPEFIRMFGFSDISDAEGRSMSELHVTPEGYNESGSFYETTLKENGVVKLEGEFKRKDGKKIWVRAVGQAVDMNSPADLSKGVIWIGDDITERKENENQLVLAHAELDSFFNNSMVGVLMLREGRTVYRVNQRMADILKYDSVEEIHGKSVEMFHVSHEKFVEFGEMFYNSFVSRDVQQIEYPFKCKDGSEVWLSVSGKAVDPETPPDLNKGVVWIFEDITQRREAEQKLIEMATTDELTGINNRRNFMEMGLREISLHSRSNRPLSVLMLDVDHFKSINDKYGHATGDRALAGFAELCYQQLRDCDIFGRIGGEEFAVILPDTGVVQAEIVAERIRLIVEKETESGRYDFPAITVSIGIADNKEHATLDVLMQYADSALYQAKEKGRNRVVTYQSV